MNLNQMANPPAKILLSGFPGSGKTGALAALANAGWKLRILDFDGNWEVLKHHVSPTADVDIISLEDPIRMGSRTMGVDGIPVAFANADNLLDRWRYKQGDDWVDLGASKNWGNDTIVCLDTIGGLTTACWNRALALTNTRVESGDMRRIYDLAANEQLAFIRRLTASTNGYHFIAISHLKWVGPPEIGRTDEEAIKDAKRLRGEAEPSRLYPTAVGRQLAQNIAGEFPTHIRAIVEEITGKPKRMLQYLPTPNVDLKLPASPAATTGLGKLEAANGLLKIFTALGHQPPPPSAPASAQEPKA